MTGQFFRCLASLSLIGIIYSGPTLAQGAPPKPGPVRPPSSKSAIVEKPPSSEQTWYFDPRWWGIGATGALSLISLLLQWRFRVIDRHRSTAIEHFDGDIRDPIKDSYKELRTLSNAVALACEISDQANRTSAVTKLRDETLCSTLNLFAMVLREADQRLVMKGSILSDINAELEDAIYVPLGQIPNCDNANERRILAKQISSAISNAIVKCDDELREQRKLFVKRKS